MGNRANKAATGEKDRSLKLNDGS